MYILERLLTYTLYVVQRVADLMKGGKLVFDENTGLILPTNADSSNIPTQGVIGNTPALSFTNYLHSPHEPVSVYHSFTVHLCIHVHVYLSHHAWFCI